MRTVVKVSVLAVAAVGAVVTVLLSASVHTFHRLGDETIIAELTFDRTGEHEYTAFLRTGNRCEERMFPLVGDQWRIDAQFLQWRYWAAALGLDAQYRVDRLDGRFRPRQDDDGKPTISHPLPPTTALDVVEFAGKLGPLNFLVDSSSGSSPFQSFDTRRVYYVTKTADGIVTRTAPRAQARIGTEALAIAIERGCSAPQPLWPRVAAWTDEMIASALGVLR